MNRQSGITEEGPVFTKDHEKVMAWLLSDTTALTITDKELFISMFYDRVDDIEKFTTLLENAKETGGNFVVVGRSGLGKTSFLYRIVLDYNLCKKLGIKPIIVDYRAALPQDYDGCLISFIDKAERCFRDIDCEIHTLKPNQPPNLIANARAIFEHLKYIAEQDNTPHIVIFLDDFDYADDVWFKLLDYFISFAQLSPASVVLTVRPPLLASIKGYDNRQAFHYTTNVNRIRIDPLPVREVLASRLAPVLVGKGSESILDFIVELFNKKKTIEERLVKKLRIKNLEQLAKFEYPLTEKHNNFMRLITNGDLREVFNIAYNSICFVMDNHRKLVSRVEFGYKRYVIGHENTLKLFCDRNDSRYKIINIHQRRSRSRNSLWYNVLEAVKIFQVIDDIYFYPALQSLGHNQNAVDKAILFLADKENRFIEPKRIVHPKNKAKGIANDEYVITEKGEYYLYITTWKKYREKYGEPGKSLIGEFKL